MSKHKNSRLDLIDQFPLEKLRNESGKLPGKGFRIAAFLAWWVQKLPGDFASYNEIVKAIEGYDHLPQYKGREALAVRKLMQAARYHLRKHHSRDLLTSRGLGARATIDDADMIRNVSTVQAMAVERSVRKLAETDAMVDVNHVPDTPENAPLKRWYKTSVRGILKQIANPEFAQKLLPPKASP